MCCFGTAIVGRVKGGSERRAGEGTPHPRQELPGLVQQSSSKEDSDGHGAGGRDPPRRLRSPPEWRPRKVRPLRES